MTFGLECRESVTILSNINDAVQEAAAGGISVNVVGFSMGNSWIAPGEQSMSYGPMLYQLVNNTVQIRSEV